MLDRKRVPNAQGKLALESKTEMKRRGIGSPDRADAVFGAMTPVRQWKSVNIGGLGPDPNAGPMDGLECEWKVFGLNNTPGYELPGAYFG